MVGSLFFLTSVATASEAGEVVSTNIVGYLKTEGVAKSYLTGPTFVPVLTCLEAEPSYTIRLGDIKATGMHMTLDSIQFLSATDATTILAATYFVSSNPLYEGWWEFGRVGVGARYDEEDLPAGSAILCNFASGNTVKFTFPNPTLPLPDLTQP